VCSSCYVIRSRPRIIGIIGIIGIIRIPRIIVPIRIIRLIETPILVVLTGVATFLEIGALS